MELYINTYGTYVHIKDELFEIRVPDDNGQYQKSHFAAHKVSSIILPKGAALSTDAIHLALTNNIDVLVVENDGHPLGRFWHSKLGSTTKIRKRQLEASLNNQAVNYIKQWITKKMVNQAQFLKDLKKNRPKAHHLLDEKIEHIETLEKNLTSLEAENIDEVAETFRGKEGTAGRLYFEALGQIMPKKYQFTGRSYRPAKDPFNAFLNYAYGILYSRIEKALIIAGLDPFVGFLHRDDYNQKSMVFDFIEPYRIYAERVVFRLFTGKRANDQQFDTITNGYSLNKEGKQLVVEALNKFTKEEKIKYKGKNQTRLQILQSEAHQFANELIK